MQFSTRVLAAMAVPAGGAACSVSIGASSAALTVTIPEADYFMTEDGGLDGLLATWQTQLNNNVQGYPQTAAAMGHAVGWGTWSAGWLFNITSGNDTGAFGGVTMTAVSTPTYSNEGPRGGIDLAVGFNSANDAFSAGDVLDVTGTDDLCVAWVAYIPSAPVGNPSLVSKYDGANGWQVYIEAATGNIRFQGVNGGGALFNADAGSGSSHLGSWHVGLATIDRATGMTRVGTRSLAGTSYVSAETATAATTTAGTATLNVGDLSSAPGTAPTGCYVAAVYVGTGASAATGLSTNISTALTNFANAVNASWSVAMSTTDGRITVANSFWPCAVSFTNTTQRDVLGFEYDFDYPQTAAQMALALGYGTWASGSIWLCNESSGDLAPTLGSITLADGSTPTYSNQGARGGSDKAIGFDSANDRFDGGASAHNVTATDDLILLWVARVDAIPSGSVDGIISKLAAGAGYQVNIDTSGYVYFQGYTTGPSSLFSSFTQVVPSQQKQWHVGIAVLDRSTGKARVGTCAIGGSPTVSTEMTCAASSMSNSDAFRVGDRADSPGNAPTDTKIAYVAAVTGSGVATGLSANLSTALSNFASYMKSQTGTQQARGVWFPDCPLFVAESDPRMAPVGSDARTSVSGSGDRITHVGVYHRYHRSISWSHVPIDRIREQSATYANASFRTFWDDTQLARGDISWFYPGSSLCIVDHNGNILGEDMQTGGPAEGWGVTDPRAVEPKRADPNGWTGLWRVEIPELIAKDE
jgi:hypothetical protein